jgi:hypothetical protein
MASNKSQGSDLNPTNPSPTLADRVKARVAEAERGLDKRSRGNSKPKHLRPTIFDQSSASLMDSSGAQLEAHSLRAVYHEMRALYRGYRRRTGRPAVPELRSAVLAFNRGGSLKSLVDIASFLDDRKLLGW